MEAINTLKEPFPTSVIPLLDFGSADGRKDSSLEDAFVETTSVKLFLQDKHSIIVGQIGSGKSALFELLKNNSKRLKAYQDRLIIPVEESISFQLLRKFIEDEFSGHDRKLVYKLIWKFQVLNRLCEEFSKLESFPSDREEREIHDFLRRVKSKEFDESLIGKLRGLLKNSSIKIKTTISESPISLETQISPEISNGKIEPQSEINLERLYKCIDRVIISRGLKKPLVIIDRIDTFVAGEDYDTQREFIEALLEVDDDIDVSYPNIGRKIFLRADLFARLDYEALGYDKVNDNTLQIQWSSFELTFFLANRLLSALKKEGLLTEADILLSTDLEAYHLSGFDWFRTSKFIPLKIKKKIFNIHKINQERDASLLERLNKAIITKVFPREITHKDGNYEDSSIDIFEFFLSHFKDGHGKVTPRNLLTFLKQMAISASTYYDENPDQEVLVKNVNGDWEWELFKKGCVYQAYCKSKVEYIRNISKVSNEWTKYFSAFIGKRGNKKTIDVNWVKSIVGLDEEKVVSFIAYLDHIGFLYITEHHPDPKKRKYRIPIIYLPTPNTTFL